jgi:hypothetical protein
MPSPAADLIVLDTTGKLAGHGYGLSGYLPALPRPQVGRGSRTLTPDKCGEAARSVRPLLCLSRAV